MFEATTIIAVRRNGQTAIAGDGQVTFGQNTIMKQNAKKVRKLFDGQVVAGFAGSVADAFTLFAKFEEKLKQVDGNLTRAAVDLAREWRSDRVLRRLEALLIVANLEKMFIISGTGELIEAEDGIAAIGSGGAFALAAARALFQHSDMGALDIACEALNIAAQICIYTNGQISFETVEAGEL